MEILTAKQLTKELHDYAKNSIQTEKIDPNFDAFTNYWALREQVWDYQRQHQVSGLESCSFTLTNGLTCTYLTPNGQLTLLDSDVRLMRSQKNILVNFFLSNQQAIYEHYQGLAELNDYPYEKAPTSRVLMRSKASEWADLWYHERCEQLHLTLGCGDHSKGQFVGNKYTEMQHGFVARLDDEMPIH